MEITGIFGGMFEQVLEFANTGLALIVIAFAISMAKLMRGGAFAAVWKWLAIGIVIYGLGFIYSLLGHKMIFGLAMFDVHDSLDLLTLISFLIALYKGRRALI